MCIDQVLYTPELNNPVLGTKLTNLIIIVVATFIMEKAVPKLLEVFTNRMLALYCHPC